MICCLQETHTTGKNKLWLRVKGYHSSENSVTSPGLLQAQLKTVDYSISLSLANISNYTLVTQHQCQLTMDKAQHANAYKMSFLGRGLRQNFSLQPRVDLQSQSFCLSLLRLGLQVFNTMHRATCLLLIQQFCLGVYPKKQMREHK